MRGQIDRRAWDKLVLTRVAKAQRWGSGIDHQRHNLALIEFSCLFL